MARHKAAPGGSLIRIAAGGIACRCSVCQTDKVPFAAAHPVWIALGSFRFRWSGMPEGVRCFS